MAVRINDLPNELLCKVLNHLDTKQKFRARLVCKRWKSQVDENVGFHVSINDFNYDGVSRRFGTSRCVTSLFIDDYSKADIPIHNLASLKILSVRGNVHEEALTELLSKAKNLYFLQICVHHGRESGTINPTRVAKNYAALRSIKELYISYDCRTKFPWLSARAWNEILYEEMPNVHRLDVDLYPNIPEVKGFDYFRLAAGMPKLRDFRYRLWSRRSGILDSHAPQDAQPLTPTISMGLDKLNLIRLEASINLKDEPIWKLIFATQRHIQVLSLCNEMGSKESFPFSMILPVIHHNKESLRSISLEIDTTKSGDIDMEIFSSLPSLQELRIGAWPKQAHREYADLSNILNCSSVVSQTLQKLSVIGFKLAEDDIINVIKKIPSEHLQKVQISPDCKSVWESLEKQMEKMGIARHGNSSACPSRYFSLSPKTSKVYVSAFLEKFYDYGFVGLLKYDYSRRVKYLRVESQSLQLEERFMFSYK